MPDRSCDSMVSHYTAVLGFVRRLVRDAALAEDLTQETFLRAQRSDQPPSGDATERSWLHAIALNLVRDHFRAAGRQPATTAEESVLDQVPSDHDLEQSAAESEMSQCIGEFVMQLPHPQCDVVALHDAAGLTHPRLPPHSASRRPTRAFCSIAAAPRCASCWKNNCVLSFDGDGMPCERRSRCDG